jgi:hypothetical protein
LERKEQFAKAEDVVVNPSAMRDAGFVLLFAHDVTGRSDEIMS